MARCGLIAVLCLSVVGVVFVCAGSAIIFYMDYIIKYTVNQNVMLKNGTEGYKAWLNIPTPIFMEFNFFHVLNPDEVLNGVKPYVQERGPYVYREIREKRELKFNDDSTRLHFREGKTFIFDAERSKGSESDLITTVSFDVLTIAHQIRYKPVWLQNMIMSTILSFDVDLFTTKSVQELLWGFVPDFVEKVINKMPLLKPLLGHFTVGFLSGSTGNGTDSGPLEISTGSADISQVAQVLAWRGSSTMSYWTSDICNMINGTDGSQFHPNLDKEEKLYVFSVDMCRSVYIRYSKTSHVSSSSIPVYQYRVPAELFANTTVNPDNEGFCTPRNNCMKTGVLNVSVCKDNVPIILSLPHFLYADESYLRAVDGLEPSAELHDTVTETEPMTGFILHGSRKLQINFYVDTTLDNYEPLKSLNESVVFPLMWVHEHATISDREAARFKHEVLQKIAMGHVLVYSMIGIGVFIIIAILLSLICGARTKRADERERGADMIKYDDDDDDDDEPLLYDVT